MLSSIEQRLRTATQSENPNTVGYRIAWIETTVVVLNGLSGLLATYLHVLTKHSSFKDCWRSLLGHYQSLLDLDILDINTAVFKALGQILVPANTNAELEAILDRDSVDLVWQLWSRGLPFKSEEIPGTNNQDCLIAYIVCLKELYRLIQEDTNFEQTQRILVLLQDAVKQAHVASYSADIEYLTTLQTRVLEALKMIRTDITGVPAALMTQVATFAALPFQDENIAQTDRRRPTHVALSKASMGLLQSLAISHAQNFEIYSKPALSSSLVALSKPIALKYAFPIKSKGIPPWQLATNTALSILKATIPVLRRDAPVTGRESIPIENERSIWAAIVRISNGIIAADCSAEPNASLIKDDQNFDIESFLTLRHLIIPTLGRQNIPDSTRRSYTEALFYNSIVHVPEPRELPRQNQDFLASLYQIRKGRTVDPSPSPRTKMSFICLQELFSLVQRRSSLLPDILLAKAAAPYLILRVSLTLRAYIADQPLRGLMPQPLSQRKELLYILKALVELEAEVEAIPDTPGVEGDGKNHLYRLYPLLAKAVRAAARDQEVLEWLGRALDEVGKEISGKH